MIFRIGALVVVMLTAWVAADAARRDRNWFGWAGLVALTGIFGAIAWVVARRRSPVTRPLGVRGSVAVLRTAFPLFLLPIFIAVMVWTFLLQEARVQGHAMAPTVADQDRVIVDKLTYRVHPPRRGDIVVLYYPLKPERVFVKRVIAEEGDQVRIVTGRVYVNDVAMEEPFVAPEFRSQERWGPQVVPQGYCFVMGDRRTNSSDSRHWGFVPVKYVIGKVQARWWPISQLRRY